VFERVRDSYEFPTDLADEGDPRAAFRWTAGVVATSAGLLALTNAAAISSWAAEFAPGPVTVHVVQAADGWEAATASVGLGTPHARMHRLWKRAEQARWDGSGKPVEQAAVRNEDEALQ
jgi:hypothetical protein